MPQGVRIGKEGPKDGLKRLVYKWTEAWEVEECSNSLRPHIYSSQMRNTEVYLISDL